MAERKKTRWEEIAEEPGIGMDNDGKLNVTGFDQKTADGWAATQTLRRIRKVVQPDLPTPSR